MRKKYKFLILIFMKERRKKSLETIFSNAIQAEKEAYNYNYQKMIMEENFLPFNKSDFKEGFFRVFEGTINKKISFMNRVRSKFCNYGEFKTKIYSWDEVPEDILVKLTIASLQGF